MSYTYQKSIPDDLVPDSVVGGEFEISQVTLRNWTHDADRGFPPQVKIGKRCYRSRKLLEAYKARLLRKTVAEAKRIFGPHVLPPRQRWRRES
jgi:hypothetical protein